jgi:molybdenum-dependent DNA-binding transcriptional regulator ModE
VLASPGGQHGGGAGLTPLGGALVGAYRAMEADAAETVARHFAPLRARMRDDPPDSDPPDAAAPDADPSAADQRTRGA